MRRRGGPHVATAFGPGGPLTTVLLAVDSPGGPLSGGGGGGGTIESVTVPPEKFGPPFE